MHFGSSFSSSGGFQQLIEQFSKTYKGCKTNYGICGGDMIEAITVDDKRFDFDSSDQSVPLQQAHAAVKKLEPIKDKLLAVLQGNHEYKLAKFGDLAKEIADNIKVPYGTYSCIMSIKDTQGKLMYKIFYTHGAGNISSAADNTKRRNVNMELSLERFLRDKAGDCAVMVKAHSHKLIVSSPVNRLYLTSNEKIHKDYTKGIQNADFIEPEARWYGCSGSFLRLYREGYSGYAERAGYNPSELGYLILVVRDKKIVSLDKVVIE